MGSNMNICVPGIYHSPQLEVCNALLLVAHCSPIIDYVNSPTGSPRGQRWPYLSKAKRFKRAHLHVLKPPSHVPSVIPVHPTRIVPSHPTPVSPVRGEKRSCKRLPCRPPGSPIAWFGSCNEFMGSFQRLRLVRTVALAAARFPN